jgi:hypothetical protein
MGGVYKSRHTHTYGGERGQMPEPNHREIEGDGHSRPGHWRKRSFIVRALPTVDMRSATSVLIFGPMTAMRPLISIGGVLYGIIPATRWEVRALGVLVLALMLGVELLLDRIAELQMKAPEA